IYSTAGRLVIQKQIDSNMAEVNIEWLVPGVYFVRLFCEEGGQPVVQKFIKE
ncbi:MAG: T9SS type A sorting domain-containing protein, partial [Bacteroidales bacterium]|nr:T9SS type A sorting domain-containing protein [Bacteroidales bacterium]